MGAMTIFPVILPVAETGQRLSGKEKVARLSRISREALELSAQKSGIVLKELLKNEDDVPRPSDGNYSSLSHKPKYVAAVVSRDKVGIDIEEINPRSQSIFSLVASDSEWELSEDRSWRTFFRYWTAKEATLKAVGVGISGLGACKLVSIPDMKHMVLNYRSCLFLIEQLIYKNHIISVLKNSNTVEWYCLDGALY